jgi:CBS domain-containing membrane protein
VEGSVALSGKAGSGDGRKPGWRSLLGQFIPGPGPVGSVERVRACAGALLGVLITGFVSRLAFGGGGDLPLLIAPMGASAVLLFVLPASPLAQPWSILGGNIAAALVGVTCARLVPDPVLAASFAIFLAIGAMMLLRCVHPPSGAVALTAVLGGPAIKAAGYGFALWPVGLNSLLLLLAALAFNNLTGRRYPHPAPAKPANVHRTKDPAPTARTGFTPADLDVVLKRYDRLLDIARDDLDRLLHQVVVEAYHRRFGEITCQDIMSRDLATVAPDAPLQEAWKLLIAHRIKALPVVANGHLVGIVTQTDFVESTDWGPDGPQIGLRRRLRHAVRLERPPRPTVRQIMTASVRTAAPEMAISDLVPVMADLGLHHVPVVDRRDGLVGIVTQSDLIAALFHARLAERAPRSPEAGPTRLAA